MISQTLFNSLDDKWATPQYVFDYFNRQFSFTLDVCASKFDTKCDRFFSLEENGLLQDWGDNRCWMNPPYGKEISLWMEKAFNASKRGATVVCLVPARTDTRWWFNFAQHGEVMFISGRLKFGSAVNSAPFPSAVIIFGANYKPNTVAVKVDA